MPIRMLAAVACTLFLCACAGNPPSMRSAKIEHAGDGAVVMRVLPNQDGGAAQFFKNWNALIVARVPESAGAKEANYQLAPVLDGTSRTAVYAAGLPPGDYRFVQFSSQQCGAICVGSSLTVAPEFSRFRIVAGRLTDLGVIIQSNAPEAGRGVLLAHDSAADHPETTEVVRELLPDLAGLAHDNSLSWIPASVPAEMGQLREYTLTHNVGLASPQPIDGGGFVYGTANGMLLEARPGGRLLSYDVGARNSIDTVLVDHSGHWIVGGELGLLRISTNHGKSWRSIRGNIPFGVIVDLSEWHGRLIATTLRGKEVFVHSAATGESQWEQIAHYQTDLNRFWDVPGVRAQSFLVGDGLITALPGRRMAYLDLNTKQDNVLDLPGAIQMFEVSADGVIRCRCMAVIATNPYESTDLGKTWKSSSASRYMLLPAFRDDKHGVAFKGGLFAHPKMVYTEDGGLTWAEGMDAPAGARKVFYSKDGTAAFVGTAYGSFWTSSDDGKSWKAF